MQGRNTSERLDVTHIKDTQEEKKKNARILTTNHNEKMAQSESLRVRRGTVSHCRKRARERLQCCTEISQEDPAPSETPSYGSDQGKPLLVSPHRLPPDPTVVKHKCERTPCTNSYTRRNSFAESWSYTAMESERSHFTCLQVSAG